MHGRTNRARRTIFSVVAALLLALGLGGVAPGMAQSGADGTPTKKNGGLDNQVTAAALFQDEDDEDDEDADQDDDEDAEDEDDSGADEDEDAGDEDDEDAEQDDEDADDEENGDASGDEELETYESPQYGYVLAYDPEEWEISGEDDDEDDPYDRVQFTNGESYVSLIGDPDYGSEQMDRCVADYQGGLEQGEGVDDVEPLEDEDGEEIAGEDDGLAFVAVSYTFTTQDGDELELVRYTECRAFEDDVTAVVLQVALAEDYEDQFEAREDLLEGLEAAD